jgi:Rrf2 family protein
VNLQLSTRYGLYAAAELARARAREPLTVGTVAAKYGFPEAALAKVFQHLVRSGIAVGTRGSGGGYHLSRPPSEITLLEVIEAFEAVGSPGTCLFDGTSADGCATPAECALRLVFDEVDETIRTTFAAISLETLVAKRRAVASERGARGEHP